MNIQNDSYNKFAKIILPYLLEAIKDSALNHSDSDIADIYTSLKKWDMHHQSDFFEPLIFDQWIDDLNQAVWQNGLMIKRQMILKRIMILLHGGVSLMPSNL